MVYKLALRSEAERSIDLGIEWYENQKSGLGLRFLLEVEKYLKKITEHPKHYQVRRKPYREAPLKVFPFVIIYEIVEKEVVVYSVFDARRNPSRKPV